MKKQVIKLIKFYQTIPGDFHYLCRHTPTCSNYAIIVIERDGLILGGLKSIIRILTCNPLFKPKTDIK